MIEGRTFQNFLSEARGIVLSQDSELNEDLEQYRGLSFEDFWNRLPKKLKYTDYERELYEALQTGEPDRIEKAKKVYRKIRVKKATGLGITEFMTRYVSWKCLKDNEWKNKQIDVSVIIITGARQELTNQIIGRIKGLFSGKEFKSKESVVILNGCRIEAFPTNNLAAARGLNPRLVWLDEADFWPTRYQDAARTVGERYRAKGNALLIMVSTTYLPGGLYERMDDEGDENNGYLTIEMPYQLGVGIVYDPQIIEEEKRNNPSFPMEYELQYGYGHGDIFDIESLERNIQEYDINYTGGQAGTYADPAFGSSKFGKVCGEIRGGIIYVTEAEEYERESPSRMLDVMEESWNKHKQSCKVDAAHPGFIKDLKERNIPAVGVAFGELVPETEGSNTTVTLKKKFPINASMMLKNDKVRIHPEFKKLISQMRAVKFDKMGGIDKSEVPFDLVDAFNMMCWDMKYYDYTHYDVMANKIVENNDLPVKKHTSIKLNTERFE